MTCDCSVGPHKIDVTYEGLRVPNSPFTAGVVPGCDPSRVKVYGPGENHCFCQSVASVIQHGECGCNDVS